ncbi:MAG TPA: sigma-70 family RNA polymerase sigma factor [Candidatus Angelobacter sp.]|jgi:RNA polymerase sigma factor (sigma-70 family)|nr:sigma-70 family RNA polymerase sigma factor [Candidatus Angelobacter sp.]
MASPGVLPSFEFNATYIDSLRQGDPSTEEHFVSHFSPILLRKLRKKLHSTDLAHDLRQETFLRILTVLRSDHGIREPERFEFFVLGVCNNVLHETYRQQKKVVRLDPELEMVSNAPSPDICAMAAETADDMKRMLSGLSPRVRAILEAAVLEEQDRDGICLKFGVNRNHLRLLICRAKKTLRVCAQKQLTGKTGLHVRHSCRPRRSAVTRVMSPQPVAPGSATSRPTTVFLPLLPATDGSGAHCWA